MSGTLIAALRMEERAILAELRDSIVFRRLEELRRLLELYEAQPPVGAELDAMLAERRDAAPRPIIPLRKDARTAEVA